MATALYCNEELTERNACKQRLGLGQRDCYPQDYDGSCDKAEQSLRRCLAFASCTRSARVVYSVSSTRKEKVEANSVLQKCLSKKHTSELGCKRNPGI